MDAVVMGLSPDGVKSHQKFKAKYELPYLLLVDEGHRVADQYDIWKEKVLYGVHYMGVERTTVIVGKDGKVAKIFRKVKVPGHVQDVSAVVALLK
jgi:peroxiredoxin Q/BCP